MKNKFKRLSFFILVCFIFLPNHKAFAVFEEEENSHPSVESFRVKRPINHDSHEEVVDTESKKQKVEQEKEKEPPFTSAEEEYKNYTHTHFFQSPTNDKMLKALYVSEEASIDYHDQQQDIRWTRHIANPEEDDKNSGLLKDLYSSLRGTPNYLTVSFEFGYLDEGDGTIKWKITPLCDEEERREVYCSNPATHDYTQDFDKYGEIKNMGGHPLKLEEKSSPTKIDAASKENLEHYPILKDLDPEFIDITFNRFPHTEVMFLNRIYTDESLLTRLLQTTGITSQTLRGIIIKIYSFNDICKKCQEVLVQIQSILQEKFCAQAKIKVPMFFVGVGNKIETRNGNYFRDVGEECTAMSWATCDVIKLLKKEVKWEDIPLSKYTTKSFNYFSGEGEFQPYGGSIKKTPLQKEPCLFLRLKVPDLEGFKEYFDDSKNWT